MTGFVKAYPRAVVRIARPTAAQPGWGPQWRVWTFDHNGSLVRDAKGRPVEYSLTPREAALDDAQFTIGLIRQGRRAALTRAGATA